MRLDLSNIIAAPVSRLLSYDYNFPYFLKIPIQGVGTGNVEALSSYLSRQAELLSEWSHPYTQRLLKAYLDPAELPKEKQIPSYGMHACNGIGVMQARFSKAIREASGNKIDPDLMTLKPIEFLTDFNNHGLMRDALCWCASCFKDDVDKGLTPYVRLYWTIQQTQVCAIHNERLIDLCPACGSDKLTFPKLPKQHLCDKCGHELYKITGKQTRTSSTFTDEQSWFSHAIYNLIERLSSGDYEISTETVSNAIKRLVNTSKIDVSELSKTLQVDPRMLNGLIDETRRPYFPAFMDMCYRLDIPPDQFLFDRDNLTAIEQWKTHPHIGYVSMAKLSPRKKQKIYQDLKKALKSKSGPPARVSHIASKHGIRFSTIRYNFPTEYKELTQRRSAWERKFRQESHQTRIENLTAGIYSLARQGIYPSERKLRDLDYVIPSDLRREDIKLLLSTFQDIYRSHGFLDN